MQPDAPRQWFERAGGREWLAERLTWGGLGRRTLAGVGGGLAAGCCMMVFGALCARSRGYGYWMPARLAAAMFMGVGALVSGAGAVAIGLAVHAFTSIVWGIVFAVLVPRSTSPARALAYGLAHGLLVWSTMTWTVLPWADPTLYARYGLMAKSWFAANLIYGAASASIIFILKLFPRQRLPT